MGYNNNHAGMRMIWHRWSMDLDTDSRYYDRMADQERFEKVQVNIVDNKVSRRDMEKSKKGKNHSNNSTKKKSNKSDTFNIQPIVHAGGTELLIDYDLWNIPEYIMANIMIMALKKKADIKEILLECEETLARDKYGNPRLEDRGPMGPYVFVFLGLLAKQLDCEIYEFFIDNEKRREEFIYSFLEEITITNISQKLHWIVDKDTKGNAIAVCEDFDEIYKMSNRLEMKSDEINKLKKIIEIQNDTSLTETEKNEKLLESVKAPVRTYSAYEYYRHNMSLTVEKGKTNENEDIYRISFGSMYLYYDEYFDCLPKGAVLKEGADRRLKEFVERVLAGELGDIEFED